ncbi:hypothetical protein D3273_02065 [Lichenibacterium minor]|uniref:Uncharacterized protein n=1 Tax=Lichenibacterium minor TaxID=2316528 RepID=A0A4Q2UD98_9HYPH|nr:hypothetical protein [Lichenibacterium minor]RYC34058.1 hypothetical protein D3273_02065 [Lichenibacterium minor]
MSKSGNILLIAFMLNLSILVPTVALAVTNKAEARKHHRAAFVRKSGTKKLPQITVKNGSIESPETVPLFKSVPISSLPQAFPKFFDLDKEGNNGK